MRSVVGSSRLWFMFTIVATSRGVAFGSGRLRPAADLGSERTRWPTYGDPRRRTDGPPPPWRPSVPVPSARTWQTWQTCLPQGFPTLLFSDIVSTTLPIMAI